MSRLSVITLTKNEAHNIADCLHSVDFADEKIVFDCGSTDETVAIAKQMGAQVFQTDWPGESVQRNRALAQATGDWVLVLDADERLSEPLQKRIQAILASPIDSQAAAYEIAFQSYYLGRAIRFGDWRGEKHVRLFKQGILSYTTELVHCRLQNLPAKPDYLPEVIYHHPYCNLETVLNKVNRYSSQSAATKFAQHRQSNLGLAMVRGLWRFIYGYFFKLGFLDGKEGFLLALSNAEGTFYRYMKLCYLNNEKNETAL